MISPSEPKQPASPEEETPAPSDLGALDGLALDTTVLAPGPAPASTDELFKQFMKAYLETQTFALV